jgi:uncharacterized membrane protein YhaH (DUF805 family)
MEEWFLNVFNNKYADFWGRARRKEFWIFNLFQTIILAGLTVLEMIGGLIDGGLAFLFFGIYLLAFFALLTPSLAVLVRRLHDTGRSGWFIFIVLIPFVGFIILLIFLCLDSQPGENQYGLNPKEFV